MTSIALNDNQHRGAAFRLAAADAVLFDIDGTLINSRDGVHYHAFHGALRHAWNIEDKIDKVPVHGNTDLGILRAVTERHAISPEAFAAGLSKARPPACNRKFVRRLPNCSAVCATPASCLALFPEICKTSAGPSCAPPA